MNDIIEHYERLIDEGNDPVFDSEPLRAYMNKWDGQDFIDKMHLDDAKTVLEIGVGTGRLAIKVAKQCKSFLGIDISPKTVERARHNLPFNNINIVCDDFIGHRFDKKFDIIYSSLTFMHIDDKAFAVKKIASLLNNNGRFLLSIDKNQDDFIDMGSRRIKVYPDSPEEIKKLIVLSNLKIEEIYETEFAHIFVTVKPNNH